MIDRRLQLATRRGELLAQSRMQRQQLSRDLAPLADALGSVDRGLHHLNRAGRWLQRNPAVVAVAVATLVVLRPRRVFGLLRRVWRLRGLLAGAAGAAGMAGSSGLAGLSSRLADLAPLLRQWLGRRS